MHKNIFRKSFTLILGLTLSLGCLTGCGKEPVYDDIATNKGYEISTIEEHGSDSAIISSEETINNTESNTPEGIVDNTEISTSADAADSTETSTSADAADSTETPTSKNVSDNKENSTSENVVDNTENNLMEASTDVNQSAMIGSAIPKNDIKIGILYTTTPTEYIGYTYTHDLGIQGMQDNLGLSDEQIIRKIYIDETNATAIRKAIQECVDGGCNIIFTTSGGYSEVTAAMAKEYPNIYFANANGDLSNGTNFINYSGLSYQADYLSGIAAGKQTKTNKIGLVAPMDINNSEITSGINAFAMGVHSVNPEATVYIRITTSWLAPKSEEQCAKDLTFIGCDVLAQHCYTTAPQQVADINGFSSIGYNTDTSKEPPNATLCSITTDWSAYYTFAVQNVINGTWTGENYYGGLKEGLYDITALNENLNDKETISLIEDIKAQILNDSFHVFSGLIETNTGTTIGATNSILDNATISDDTNWYYKNVLILRSNGDITDGTELLAESKKISQ